VGVLLAPPAGESDICSHQIRYLGSRYTKNGHKRTSDVFRAHGTCLVHGCKCRPISVKRNLKIEANVVVSECSIYYRVVVY